MSSLEKYIQNQLEAITSQGRQRILHSYLRTSPTSMHDTNNDCKDYISFNDNDYLNLSNHPEVIEKTHEALKQHGMGIRASRLVTGNHPLYTTLEKTLADFKQTESALVFGSGYLTNISIIPALASKGDLIIADKLVHACMIDGALLSGAKFMRFSHNDAASCKKLLQEHRPHYRHCLILTETVFSMDGDIAPIAELYEIANQYDALLITDDAHGLGILPYTSPSHLHMGTFSKALGGYGGYVCGPDYIKHYLLNTARSLIYSTALPLPIIAGVLASFSILKNNFNITKIPIDNAQYFTQELNLPLAQSAIVPLQVGDSHKALSLSEQLKDRGILVPAIRPPTVPQNTARLRFTFSAAHTKIQLNYLIKNLKELLDNA